MASEVADIYMSWLSDNYEAQKRKLSAFCMNSGVTFDEDVYSDTALKVYEKICNEGSADPTPTGFENYLFKSFRNNIIREKQYARIARMDDNYFDVIDVIYDDYANKEKETETEKLKNDLWKDYATLYLMNKVEENFDAEHSYIFRLKTFLPKMTYRKLREETNLKNIRQKYIDVKRWLKDNITKDEIKNAFEEKYGDLLDN